jgi:hypothetical protein
MAEWLLIATAPFGTEIEVAVIDGCGIHVLVVPVRQTEAGWLNAESNARVDIRPTHWRAWRQAK